MPIAVKFCLISVILNTSVEKLSLNQNISKANESTKSTRANLAPGYSYAVIAENFFKELREN
jgi:hypothetical protein